MQDSFAAFIDKGRGSMGPDTAREQAEMLLNQAHDTQRAIAELTADGYGPKHLVGVRINASGQVLETVVSPRSAEIPAAQLAAEFTAAHGAAVRELAAQIKQIAGPLVTDREAYHQMSSW